MEYSWAILTVDGVATVSFENVDVCGIPIARCRADDLRQLLRYAVEDRIPPQHLATVNLDFLRLATEDPEFRAVLLGCDHRFADGWPILSMARRRGLELPERVTGSDLTPAICRWARDEGWRIGFVGGSDEVRDRLREVLPGRFGIEAAGHWTPRYAGRDLEDPALADEICAARVDILLVALGCPKQEFWIRENFRRSGAKVAMGVGASLDFLSGRVRRAPRWVQGLRMEFLYRVAQEPLRLGGRYWRDFLFYLQTRDAGVPATLPPARVDAARA